jgi:hypothetical protein
MVKLAVLKYLIENNAIMVKKNRIFVVDHHTSIYHPQKSVIKNLSVRSSYIC